MPRSRPYLDGLNSRLKKDSEYAAAYLTAARKVSRETFLLALRDVVQAYTISKVATATGFNRETLYRTLSPKGNPTLATLDNILSVLGLENSRIQVKRKLQPSQKLKNTQSINGSSTINAGISRIHAPMDFELTGGGMNTGKSPVRLEDIEGNALPAFMCSLFNDASMHSESSNYSSTLEAFNNG